MFLLLTKTFADFQSNCSNLRGRSRVFPDGTLFFRLFPQYMNATLDRHEWNRQQHYMITSKHNHSIKMLWCHIICPYKDCTTWTFTCFYSQSTLNMFIIVMIILIKVKLRPLVVDHAPPQNSCAICRQKIRHTFHIIMPITSIMLFVTVN